ncbi:hypothetical protein CsSME_00045332 [Camellia sinensis var. sinensis]
MPGLDPDLVSHYLDVFPNSKPIKQAARKYHPDLEEKIKEEIEKLQQAGFIRPIQYPTWLANIVPVKKKNGQIRVCVDFRDLNKSCPKDEFPLPHIDTLVDTTSGHQMFSFMDGFSGYNQIKMAEEDAEKTAFRTPLGNFFYTVMPFGLKNAGATYQRAMTAIFHDMIHHEVEDYVDDLVVKSKKEEDHLRDLEKVFKRCQKFKMRMNPLKCAFGVTAGKFLGFLVHRHGIEADEDKVKSIRAMPPPHSQKELKKFLGKVSYIRRFIPALAEISAPFGSLLKGDAKFEWNQEHQKAFERIKAALTSPQTMIAPQPGVPLMLYLTSTPKSIGALLVQDVDGVERPVYYISRKIRGAEVRYTPVERHCLALVFTAQKLRHYFLAHQIQIVTKSDPIRYLLSKPALTGKVARWLLALGEFEITCVAPKAIKSQALADLLAQFPSGDYEPVNEELRGEVHATMASEESFWTLSFDGAAAGGKGGTGIVLTSKSGEKLYLSYKLDFHCSNNEAEYEALILGLIAAEKHSIKKIRIRGDSKLIVKQVSGQFVLKEPALATYRTTVQRLLDKFQKVEIEHVPRSDNKFSDALATLGARVDIPEEEATIVIKKRTEPSIIPEDKGLPEDWRGEVLEQLRSKVGKLTMAKLAQFTIIQGELYFRGGTGFLARCVGQQEASFRLQQIHEKSCGDGDISLYRRIQRQGYYWPEMEKDSNQLQKECPKCQSYIREDESCFEIDTLDWRQVYIDYLKEGTLPESPRDIAHLKRRARRYFLDQDKLYRRSIEGTPLRCLSKEESDLVLGRAHEIEHQGGARLFEQLIHLGYYWPTMESDASHHVKRCQTCQKHGNLIHAPAVDLHSIRTPWPFHTWAFDLIGPISTSSKGYKWILAATELSTKWVEAIPLKNATGPAVANFIKENIICRFGVPNTILSDNGTPFINKYVKSLLETYQVKHHKSTPYYPKGNGQAEATNKTLIRILSKMMDEFGGTWSEQLIVALWAYRTSKRKPTQATPYSLVYGSEAVLPIELETPSARMALASGMVLEPRTTRLEALEEKHDRAVKVMERYHESIARAYNQTVVPRKFEEGDLVWKIVDPIMRGQPLPKFSPKWEGPYKVVQASSSGYYKLVRVEDGFRTGPLNAKFIKHYYP